MDATAAKIVLYIEDNPVNLHLMKAIFAGRAGEKLLSATRGEAGLRLAEEHRPALILLDLHLPDISGVEFLRRLRGLAGLASTPVIIVTGASLDEARLGLQDLNVAEYVAKPIDIALFEQLLDRYLRA